MKKFLGLLLMILSIPLGLYMWLKWGWYDGFVLAYNGIVNSAGAGTFAWGVIKVLIGSAVGVFSGWIAFTFGLLMISTNTNTKNKNRRF